MTAQQGQSNQALQQFVVPKAEADSAGVQRQYCAAPDKKANCQIAVNLHCADEQNSTSQPLG